jgi:hypothetical protein
MIGERIVSFVVTTFGITVSELIQETIFACYHSNLVNRYIQ